MIDACHFDCGNRVDDALGLARLLNLLSHRFEGTGAVLDGGWFDNDPSVVITQEPSGPLLSAVNCDNAELLRADLLNPLLDDPTGLADVSLAGFGF
jgi:hypothetical protein